MELLTGDRENGFPQQIMPFPEPSDLPTVLESANAPPRKLRPIRRSPAEYLLKSSSSDGDHADMSTESKAPGKRTRKRKTREKIESFFESMVMKIMEKQEQMNRQLIEMIEKRERERIITEEAWKQQEIERMKRDEEIQAQETARCIALVSFIQNVLGQEIEIPQALPVSCMEEGDRDGGNHATKNIPRNPNNRRCNETWDPNRRWQEAEIQSLIMLRSTLEHKFCATGSKCSIWDEISDGMHNLGYDRSARKCKEKWENMNKYFRKSMENGKKHLEKS